MQVATLAPPPPKTFTPSFYQARIFDWIRTGRGDAVVNAVAGAGKTTTLVHGANHINSANSIFLAFNKHIAEELSTRLAGTGMTSRTIHSAGNSALWNHFRAKLTVDGRKYPSIAKQLITECGLGLKLAELSELTDTLRELCDKSRLTLTDHTSPAALRAMAQHFAIDLPISERLENTLMSLVPEAIEAGERLATDKRTIDFTDMLFLPLAWDLRLTRYEWLFADESQDFSALQRTFIYKMRAAGGRALWVGDPHQSIMGFAGADSDSFYTIQRETVATELPLSICYRCPSSHIRLAQSIVPAIEARPNAPDGVIGYLTRKDLRPKLREGDLIICRVTAPLISECINLIRERVPARVRGRDIGAGLCALLRKIAKADGFDYSQISRYLNQYREAQINHLRQREADESAIESINDRVECLLVCASEFTTATSIEQLCSEIEALFSDDRPGIWLSSVHRSKGLESQRVFILKPEKLPLVWKDQLPWQYEQEMNLKYVALTRAKEELWFVED